MPEGPQKRRSNDIAPIIEKDNIDVDELNRLGQRADKMMGTRMMGDQGARGSDI
jgi:hypothetical protein